MAFVLQPLDSSLPARGTVSGFPPAVMLEEWEVWAGLVWTAWGWVWAPGSRAVPCQGKAQGQAPVSLASLEALVDRC